MESIFGSGGKGSPIKAFRQGITKDIKRTKTRQSLARAGEVTTGLHDRLKTQLYETHSNQLGTGREQKQLERPMRPHKARPHDNDLTEKNAPVLYEPPEERFWGTQSVKVERHPPGAPHGTGINAPKNRGLTRRTWVRKGYR
jgi:hypothetical protein